MTRAEREFIELCRSWGPMQQQRKDAITKRARRTQGGAILGALALLAYAVGRVLIPLLQ
jgi:hypothetical protein